MSWEPVLHSVSYAGVWPGQARLSLDDFLDKAAELGYAGVMLMAKRPHLSVLDYGPEACAALRDRMEAQGLRCRVIAGYNNFSADAGHPEIPQREIQIDHVTALCRMARDLGAPVVRVFTAYEHPALPHAALWKLLVDTLREAARRAADFGVTLGVQNHHDLAAHSLMFEDLLREVDHPHCRACFDAWSPALQGDDLYAAARRLARWTVHTTVADYQSRPRFRYDSEAVNYTSAPAYSQAVPMGQGFIDYAAFFRGLREGGYTGPAAYEMCSPLLGGGALANLDHYARRFAEWLRRLPA